MDPQMNTATVEHAVHKSTYVAAAVTAGVSAWGLRDWGIILSMVIAIATFATTLFFKIRDDRRKQRLFEAAIEEERE